MLTHAWCIICGAKLSVTQKDGEIVRSCPTHGVMLPFFNHDPAALSLEDGAKIMQQIAKSSFQEAT